MVASRAAEAAPQHLFLLTGGTGGKATRPGDGVFLLAGPSGLGPPREPGLDPPREASASPCHSLPRVKNHAFIPLWAYHVTYHQPGPKHVEGRGARLLDLTLRSPHEFSLVCTLSSGAVIRQHGTVLRV